MNWEKFSGYPAHIVAKRVNTDSWLEPWRDELVQELTLFLWQMFASGKVNVERHEKAVSAYVYRGLQMRLTHEIRRLKVSRDLSTEIKQTCMDDGAWEEGPASEFEAAHEPLADLDNHLDTHKILSNLHPNERSTLSKFFGGFADKQKSRGEYNKLLAEKNAILAVIRGQVL